MVAQVLCVAEKPSIAKAVAQHLAGGNVPSVGNRDFFGRFTCPDVYARRVLEDWLGSKTTNLIILSQHGDLARLS